jgi:putative tryptophan/tyrosine transport system substrate-binding protein
MQVIFPRQFCLVVAVFVCLLMAAPEVPASDKVIALVVSRKIRPYVEVTDGIMDRVSQAVTGPDVYFLSPEDDPKATQVKEQLIQAAYDLVAAVGPEAASLVWEPDIPGRKIYAALLDPDTVAQLPDDACGISLRIPVPVQVAAIAQEFPSLQKIGLLFDPGHNQWFFDAAVSAAASWQPSLEIIPLQVTSRSQIGQVLKDSLGQIDAVWMIPDQTVISEKLIQYVIKQAFYANTGVIGYNPYFVRAGAFFSFEFDYRKLGNQAGDVIARYLAEDVCTPASPVFDTRINTKMVEKLGIEMGNEP